MKNCLITIMLAICVNGSIANAEILTPEQSAITSLIRKMYSIDPYEFEAATFGAKFKKSKEIVKGKFDPDRQCRLLAEFFVKEAVIKNKKDSGCLTGFRYPSADDEEISPVTRYTPLPTPKINTPVVNGGRAKVHVTFLIGSANVMYYVRKQPEGWRIYRVEYSENSATIDTQEQGDMVYVFPPED